MQGDEEKTITLIYKKISSLPFVYYRRYEMVGEIVL